MFAGPPAGHSEESRRLLDILKTRRHRDPSSQMPNGLRFSTVSERGGWDGFVDKRDPDSRNILLNNATVGVPLPSPHHRMARKPLLFLRKCMGFRALR